MADDTEPPPKRWTGPKIVDGVQVEGTFRAHQVPLLVDEAHPEHVEQLDAWMRSYRPEELFDNAGRLWPELAELDPNGARRMGANPRANGGLLLRDLRLPDFHAYAVEVPGPGAVEGRTRGWPGVFCGTSSSSMTISGTSGFSVRMRRCQPAGRGVSGDVPAVGRPHRTAMSFWPQPGG